MSCLWNLYLINLISRKHFGVTSRTTDVRMGPRPRYQLNSKDADMENALLSFTSDVTTKVLVKWGHED